MFAIHYYLARRNENIIRHPAVNNSPVNQRRRLTDIQISLLAQEFHEWRTSKYLPT